jgi:FlaG/FlaF family flagellin (archaellin)
MKGLGGGWTSVSSTLRRIAAVTVVTAVLVGCSGGNDSIVGTYVRKVQGQSQSIRFNNDGTFVLNIYGQYAGGGKYRVRGHTVILDYDADGTKRGQFDGDTFTDQDGGVWTR